MKKIKNRQIIELVITTILLGLVVYSAYSLWYIFHGTNSGADVHLYTGMTGVALGWFMLLFVQTVLPKSGIIGKILAFVASDSDFYDQPAVANGASNLLMEVFGDVPSRSAVGMVSLPGNMPIEIEAIFELK